MTVVLYPEIEALAPAMPAIIGLVVIALVLAPIIWRLARQRVRGDTLEARKTK